ncbi:MAG: DNA integrity scanning diadenylate cyclase DisA [Nanoarchaeota archaeon]
MGEIQRNIVEKISTKDYFSKEVVSEQEFFNVLKFVSPGTHFRSALEGALQSKRGALIVVENENTSEIIDGGFRIGARFTPQRVVELTKMDGAIILSKDLKKINYANVLLMPNNKFKTIETGTRHKAAERTAKQAGTLVIAISEKKEQITLYYKNIRYPLTNTGDLLRKANEHIQLLEKQRKLFDDFVEKLNHSEIKNYFDLKLAINVVQKGKLIQKVVKELEKYSIELGAESTLIKISLKEIWTGVEKETALVIKDYSKVGLKNSLEFLNELNYHEILSEEKIARALGYESPNFSAGSIKGWRILSKTLLSEEEINKIINYLGDGDLKTILESDETFFIGFFLEIEPARNLKEQLEKMKGRI